jgi:hypothetical protein
MAEEKTLKEVRTEKEKIEWAIREKLLGVFFDAEMILRIATMDIYCASIVSHMEEFICKSKQLADSIAELQELQIAYQELDKKEDELLV